jgi:hypothetical protein
VYVTPDETDSVQYFVKSVAVCFLVQLSNSVVVAGVTSHPWVIRLLVEVHVVRDADAAVSFRIHPRIQLNWVCLNSMSAMFPFPFPGLALWLALVSLQVHHHQDREDHLCKVSRLSYN